MYRRIISTRGRFYLQEVEAVWDKQHQRSKVRVVAHLGPCDEDGKLLRAPRAKMDTIHSACPVGPLAVLYAAARDLGVLDILAKATDDPFASQQVLMMALNQGVDRVATYRLPEWIARTPLPRWLGVDPANITPSTLPRALDAVCEFIPGMGWEDHGLVAQKELTKAWRGSSREPRGVFYDVTKQSYCGSGLSYAQVGHDANGGVSNVVGFGMVVSREHHHPLLCRPLPGAQHDSVALPDMVRLMQAEGVERIKVVLDRGITSGDNIRFLTQRGYDVVGLVKGWTDATRELASRWPDQELENAKYAVETSHGHVVYARAMTAPLFGMAKVRVAVVENLRKKAAERDARENALRELQEGPVDAERLREIRAQLSGLVKTVAGRRGFEADMDAVKQDRLLDGRFLIFSTDLSMDGREMYQTYFQRDAIEKVFRTGKSDLTLGPIRYRRKGRVDAYSTVFFIAYLLWSWAERRLKKKHPDLSLAEAFRLLEGVSWVRFGSGKQVREWCTSLNKMQRQILAATGALPLVLATEGR